jgi:DNA repair exonuclease SbcCD ATPase subunit
VTPETLRAVAAKIRQDASSAHFGDPRYAVVISSDKVDALTAAIPELLTQVSDLEQRQQEQEQELCALKAKVTALEVTNEEAQQFTRHQADQINRLETRVTAIAALLHADPFQTVDADLSTIEAAITKANRCQTKLREANERLTKSAAGDTARIAELEVALVATRSAAREATCAHSEAISLVGRLEIQNARLRRDGGETSATIAAWQTATFGLASTRRDRLYRSWEAMDEAWAAVRDMDWNIRRPNLSRAIRAAEELAELISRLVQDDADPRACVEVADVQIVLAGIPAAHGQEQSDLVNAKMITNRARSWKLTGDGHGQHMGES